MKNFFSIFYAFYFFLAGMMPFTDFSQLAQFPDAWKHYQEHKMEASINGEKVSLFAFFKDHYVNPDSHDHDDQDNHDNLPLNHCCPSIAVFSIAYFQFLLDSPEQMEVVDNLTYIPFYYSADFEKGLDQPPSFI